MDNNFQDSVMKWLIENNYNYLVRRRTGILMAFRVKPYRYTTAGTWQSWYMTEWDDRRIVDLETDKEIQLFPEVQWENEGPYEIQKKFKV